MPAVFELDPDNAETYMVRRTGLAPWKITMLAGGVSNTVLLAEHETQRLVLKQSLPQLRVAETWLCERSRILRESAAMKLLSALPVSHSIPLVVFEDPENFSYAMEAAPPGVTTWKDQLLKSAASMEISEQCGRLLGGIMSGTFNESRVRQAFGDLEAFGQLRLEPYYEFTAVRHPAEAPFFQSLIDDCRNRKTCLVHGDWSPKNLLTGPGTLIAIDWECVHYGNPAFDSAFLLNHLLLKSFHLPSERQSFDRAARAFWKSLKEAMPPLKWFEASTCRHCAGLLLARMDGKSPVEYIRDERQKNVIRSFALNLIHQPPATVEELLERRAACH